MRASTSIAWGLFMVLLGSSILAWIGYNFLFEMQPEAEGRSPVVPAIFSGTIILVGLSRMRRGLAARRQG